MAGQARVFGEAYFLYAATGKPRRTPFSGKRAIYGWTIVKLPDPVDHRQNRQRIDLG